MKPFFPYGGTKYNMVPHYPKPNFPVIIEPFAGTAAYSVRHEVPRVVLIEKDPIVASTWKYLIEAEYTEILQLPIDFERISNLDIPQGAKYLIGFWVASGSSYPANIRSTWGKQYRYSNQCKTWNEASRLRVASQIDKIKQWKIIEGDYSSAPDIEATWFIDPPYSKRGKVTYRYNIINYSQVAEFVKSRSGQVIVCEGEGANWLDFSFVRTARGTFGKHRSGKSDEYVYVR